MDYLLDGGLIEGKKEKGLLRMERKMVNGLNGMIMGRKKKKGFLNQATRMET